MISLAEILNSSALKHLMPSVVSIYIYLQPLFATIIAILLQSDKLDFLKVISCIFIFFGVYLVSDGSDKPYRVKVRAPSFANLQALKHMLRDAYVADAVVVLGSIDIILGEVDR